MKTMQFNNSMFMVFSATLNNISVRPWQLALLVEKHTGLEKTIDLLQVTDKLYIYMVM